MILLWLPVPLALIFGTLAVRDVRSGEISLHFVRWSRSVSPVAFWGTIAFEALASVFFGLAVLAHLVGHVECENLIQPCTVTIEIHEK